MNSKLSGLVGEEEELAEYLLSNNKGVITNLLLSSPLLSLSLHLTGGGIGISSTTGESRLPPHFTAAD